VLVKGKNAKVWDQNDREYIDCVAGNGVANLGHCNEVVTRAITEQASKLLTCGGIFYNDVRALLLEKLINITPANLTRAFLCNTGTESIEAAIKFAKLATGKTEFICAMRAFHGRTMGALSATFNPKYRTDFEPLVPGFRHVPFNNFEKLHELVSENTAAVLLEVVQGEGGVNIGDAAYFSQVQQLCRDNDVLLILDEVQTGFGRTGKMFACQRFDLQPDLMCVAKAMAGGIPMGAILCADRIEIPVGKHGSTFGGNPLACAAAISVIDYITEHKLDEQAEAKGQYLFEKLRNHSASPVREVRHLGLMFGIELKEKVKPTVLRLMDEGVLALPAGTTVLRLLPPLTIGYDELDTIADTILKVLRN
ncbi:acetylornithine/succinylornithine family transaminase, partial [bacterium]|nr:acetylornithine/succinylornithine family transaminase [bacterium]